MALRVMVSRGAYQPSVLREKAPAQVFISHLSVFTTRLPIFVTFRRVFLVFRIIDYRLRWHSLANECFLLSQGAA